MDDDFDPAEYWEPEEQERPRDRKIDEAKDVLLQRFFAGENNVFYSRQLHIWLERQYFHWITGRALVELASSGLIGSRAANVGDFEAQFYYPRRHRYPVRQIQTTTRLIQEFSQPAFTRAVGHHGEMLVAVGFAHVGFRILARKVKQVDGIPWPNSNHDLDFLIERDGVRYGVEVKNQLGYIDQTEFQIKLAMCKHWGIKPLFVCRNMPKNYMFDVYRQGGYSLITQNQNYPLLADDLAKRVRETLNLPVATITSLPDTALVRFEKFHVEQLGRV